MKLIRLVEDESTKPKGGYGINEGGARHPVRRKRNSVFNQRDKEIKRRLDEKEKSEVFVSGKT